MEHGEASKLALYGVADYTWNIANYNAIDNWERGLAELVPEATDATAPSPSIPVIPKTDTAGMSRGKLRLSAWLTGQTKRLTHWKKNSRSRKCTGTSGKQLQERGPN